jgi:hypothetical protein
MAKKIVLALLVLVAGFMTYVLTRPDTFHVERTRTVAAPANVVYGQIHNFHAWPLWSPWENLDPKMKRTFGGLEAGTGATYAWVGNDKVGEGKMTILEATPFSRVHMQLDFLKPFKSTNTSTFTLAPEAEATRVTWAMDGRHNLFSKTMCVFVSMDQMLGKEFDKGLAALDSVATAEAQRRAAAVPDTAVAR